MRKTTTKSPRLAWQTELRDRGLLRRINPIATKVLWLLFMYADRRTLEAPNAGTLGRIFGCADHPDEVRKALHTLEELGFIHSVVIKRGGRKRKGWCLTSPPEDYDRVFEDENFF